MPKDITNILGTSNREIVNKLVTNIIDCSFDKPYITMSKEVNNALNGLVKFNYDNIYHVINDSKKLIEFENMYRIVFNYYLNIINNNIYDNDIYTVFLNKMDKSYLEKNSNVRKVIDYIAGMTDNYFMKKYNAIKKG